MSSSKKLNVGTLPEQVDDYSHYEETEILWGRIVLFALIIVASLSAVLYLVFSPNEAETSALSPSPFAVKSIEETRLLDKVPEPLPLPNHEVETRELGSVSHSEAVPAVDVVGSEATPAPEAVKTAEQPVANESDVDWGSQAEPDLAQHGNKAELANADEAVSRDQPMPVISPIYTAHAGITAADLRIGYDSGERSEPLGYEVPMSDAGIIKVILDLKMDGLKGQTLFHEWYWNDKRIARVRIPVRQATQQSHSSKFINAQMIGAWKVKVVDGSQELFAEANFTVN